MVLTGVWVYKVVPIFARRIVLASFQAFFGGIYDAVGDVVPRCIVVRISEDCPTAVLATETQRTNATAILAGPILARHADAAIGALLAEFTLVPLNALVLAALATAAVQGLRHILAQVVLAQVADVSGWAGALSATAGALLAIDVLAGIVGAAVDERALGANKSAVQGLGAAVVHARDVRTAIGG